MIQVRRSITVLLDGNAYKEVYIHDVCRYQFNLATIVRNDPIFPAHRLSAA